MLRLGRTDPSTVIYFWRLYQQGLLDKKYKMENKDQCHDGDDILYKHIGYYPLQRHWDCYYGGTVVVLRYHFGWVVWL